MTQKRNWTEKNVSGTQWKPHMTEDNGMKMSQKKEDNQLEGYYLNFKDIPGKENKTFRVYSVQTLNADGSLGELKDVAGGKLLDELMDTVKQGTFIMIEYCGRKHKQGKSGPFTQTNSYHMWKIFEDHEATPLNQLKQGSVSNTTTSTSSENDQQSVGNKTSQGNNYADANIDDDDDLPF